MNRFKKLQNEEIFWNSIREYVKEKEVAGKCAFCGSTDRLSISSREVVVGQMMRRTSHGYAAPATQPRVPSVPTSIDQHKAV
jgi:hypothetical protein